MEPEERKKYYKVALPSTRDRGEDGLKYEGVVTVERTFPKTRRKK